MKRLFFKSAIAGLMMLVPAIAQAAAGYSTANVNMRSGPSTQYPAVTMIPYETEVEIYGCLSDVPWCDVAFYGGRGWVAGRYLQTYYRQRRIYVEPQYYRSLGIPLITFSFDRYWDRHYRSRPFYRDRDRWRSDWNRPRPPRVDRPWDDRDTPRLPRAERPWDDRETPRAPRAERPWDDRDTPRLPRVERPWDDRETPRAPRAERPWDDRETPRPGREPDAGSNRPGRETPPPFVPEDALKPRNGDQPRRETPPPFVPEDALKPRNGDQPQDEPDVKPRRPRRDGGSQFDCPPGDPSCA